MVVLTYLAGKLAYRLRDVISTVVVAGFLALILSPLVVGLQRRRIRRRGLAVAVVTIWTVVVFVGLVAAFGYGERAAVTEPGVGGQQTSGTHRESAMASVVDHEQ